MCAVCVLTLVSERYEEQLDFIESVWDEVQTSMIHCFELAKTRNSDVWSVMVSLYTSCTHLVH